MASRQVLGKLLGKEKLPEGATRRLLLKQLRAASTFPKKQLGDLGNKG